jgi:nucleoside 2-deoxyribosyltransferase
MGSNISKIGQKIYDIYWANALFSDADRNFNKSYVDFLRSNKYSVFLAQEQSINKEKSPDEIEIFNIDTKAVLQSKILVACIDQETIDCGVACEIGIAFAKAIPIIGLYTDIRKDRDHFKMYKNPYVIGAIKKSGNIVNSKENLLFEINKIIER